MSTKTRSKWVDKALQFFNKDTRETVAMFTDVVFYEDFIGAGGLQAFPADGSSISGNPWTALIVGDATAAIVADGANGTVLLHIHATDEAEDAGLTFNDQLGLSVLNGGVIEFTATLTTLPTTGVACVLGIAGPHNLDKDTIANHAWFRWQASGALVIETDDTTNDNDDTATGVTTVAGTYNVYKIDFSVLADVKFFVDGVRMAPATTFDMSNLSAAESVMQPYISLDKASGVGVGDLTLDYVKFWGARG